MSEASGQRPSVASYAPRHQRQDSPLAPLPEDPFVLPDPVEEQLRRWRAERSNPAPPTAEDGDAAEPSPNGHVTVPAEESAPTDSAPTDGPPVDSEPADPASADAAPTAEARAADAPTAAGPPVSTRPVESPLDPSPIARAYTPPPVPTTPPPPPAERNGHVVRPAPNGVAGRVVPEWQRGPVDGSESQTVAFPVADPVREPAPGDSAGIAIEARNLHKKFKDMVAVEDVSFTVPAGSIVALLGPNGAGKTTTVNMLCTLLKPDGGSATVNGHDVSHDAASVRKSIMLTGQFAALDEALTGRENLVLFGRLLGLEKSAARVRADELLDAFSLTDVGGKRVREYSGGMRRRIDIACGLVTAPRIVFLDEPTTGLDPRSRLEVWSLVEKLRDSGVTILLTTQYLEEADVLSDNIVVIDKGRVIAEGTSDELKASTGAAYCEVTPADPADRARLRDTLADLIADHVQSADDHFVAVPAPDGPETLVEVIQRTAAAGIPLSDVAMRRPSLDEVFLALTDPRRDRSST
ncbi:MULTISPECIES: ATP-binding cassette domain-containing protein [Gordonia]|uniref:ABC-type multidrug transport system, ATPase component n=1 Tax=Gordonia terrae C-6 TaxID=1316928 RepID=R7YAZ0_9ACTN|nr:MULTISPECIES: ATP-binding cassette domain-containing protein [Gordonia]EON33175.1 ABC-type multidrug transport system, ATPase component [Gordonia terrae C-6]